MNLSRYTLYPHQAAGAQFRAPRGRAYLSDVIHVIGPMVAALLLQGPSAETESREGPSPKNPKRFYQLSFGRGAHLHFTFTRDSRTGVSERLPVARANRHWLPKGQ